MGMRIAASHHVAPLLVVARARAAESSDKVPLGCNDIGSTKLLVIARRAQPDVAIYGK